VKEESIDSNLETLVVEVETTAAEPEPVVEATTPTAPSVVTMDTVLPPEWVDATDPTLGRVYYYNSETGVTSWERPEPLKQNEKEEFAAVLEPLSAGLVETKELGKEKPKGNDAATNDTLPESTPKNEKTTQEEDALPPGWMEAFDLANNTKYFYNSETGKTSWERPTVLPLDKPEPFLKQDGPEQVEPAQDATADALLAAAGAEDAAPEKESNPVATSVDVVKGKQGETTPNLEENVNADTTPLPAG